MECQHGYATPQHCPFCRRQQTPTGQPPAKPYAVEFAEHVAKQAKAGNKFTSETITNVIGYPNDHEPNGNNVIGRLMQKAKTKHRLDVVDYVRAGNPRSKGRTIPVYQKRGSR